MRGGFLFPNIIESILRCELAAQTRLGSPLNISLQNLFTIGEHQMILADLKPNVIVRGPIFPEPVQIIVAVPMGTSVKIIGKGLKTNQVHEPVLSHEQLAQLESTPG